MQLIHPPLSTVEQALRNVRALHVFPRVAERVRRVVDDQRSSLIELEEVVAMDPALAGQLLRVANSPFYGLSRRVSTIRQAILILGFQQTRDLALALALASVRRGLGQTGELLWRHALHVGVACRWMSQAVRGVNPAEGFVVGLLHDVGHLMLLQLEGAPYGELLTRAHGNRLERPLAASEQELLGYTHAELGAALLHEWCLPESLVLAIRHHHAPEALLELSIDAFRQACVLRLAECFVEELELARDAEAAVQQMLRAPLARSLGIRRTDLVGLVLHFDDELDVWA